MLCAACAKVKMLLRRVGGFFFRLKNKLFFWLWLEIGHDIAQKEMLNILQPSPLNVEKTVIWWDTVCLKKAKM